MTPHSSSDLTRRSPGAGLPAWARCSGTLAASPAPAMANGRTGSAMPEYATLLRVYWGLVRLDDTTDPAASEPQ